MNPVTRYETYLAKLGGQDVEIPTPVTREEALLAKACGEEVAEITPVTRREMLLDNLSGGDHDITPVTRIEALIAKAAGVEVTEFDPVTREEVFWSRVQPSPSWVWQLLTGTAPLTLLDAVAHPIHSLTQYGKCAQDGTPTPDAPVDIVCNNGALCMVDDELPAAYKRVLGFSCDNNALWEITGFQLKGSDTVRISFSINAACNVFGCYQGASANDNYDLYASVSPWSKYFRYADGTYLSYFSPENVGKRFDVVYTPNGSQGMPQDSTWTPKTFTSANDLLIGSTTLTGASSKLKGNLYGSFVVDERLKLIPCERVSDGVLGYYDTYGATFYEPYEGFDGAVSLGYDGSHYTLGVVGTSEVLTVSGANLANMVAENIDVGKIIYDTGSVANSGVNFVYTAYIPVEAGQNYVLYGREKSDDTISAYNRICWYDENKGWISRATYTQNTIGSAVAPNNAAYARFTVAPYESSSALTLDDVLAFDWTFAKANVEIPYQPYAAPQTVTNIPNLFATLDGTARDEVDLVSGVVTRRTEAVYEDGEIVVKALAEPTTEQTTPHELHTSAGTNTVDVSAEVEGVEMAVEYAKAGA